MLMCIASKLTSAAGSAPNLPLLRPAQYGRPRASLPSIVCCQMSTADTQRSASPIKRRPLLLGHGPNVPQVRLPHGKLGRAPSSPAITTCKPSSASPKVKVNWVENKLTADVLLLAQRQHFILLAYLTTYLFTIHLGSIYFNGDAP